MKWWKWVGLGVIIDQVLKTVFLSYFPQTIVFNQGVFFGLFPSSWWLVFNFIILTLMAFFLKKNQGIILILAGGTANFIDRFFRGKVVDFMDWKISWLPVFNLADIFICLGTGILAINFIFSAFNFKKD